MATFYAQYPASSGVTTGPVTVQGEGTAGAQTGGVLTVQGDPAGTPIPITGSISATNPSVGPTGSAVPASATYLGGINGGNLVGVAVDSSGHLIPAVVSDTTATGTITSTQNVSIATAGYATVGVQVTGTFTGTIFVEWSPDGTNWYNTTYASIQTGALALTFTAAGAGTIQCSGAANVRLRGGSVATGTATVYLRANSTPAQLMIDNPLPTGSNTIGAVNQAGNWSTRTQDGSGNAITSTANALDVNIKTSSITNNTNITQFGGNNVVTGTGASGVGIPRVTVSNDSNVLATQSGTWNITNVSGTVSLPTGASTSALQTTGNTSLASIDTKTPALGQTTMAGSTPVAIASNQSAIPVTVSSTAGRSSVLVYNNNNGSANISTSAYTQITASTSGQINRLYIADTSGQGFFIATGAAASEVNVLVVPPGGNDSPYELQVASSTRLSVKALTANMTAGYLYIVGLS